PSHRDYAGRNQVLNPDGSNLGEETCFSEDTMRYSEWIESEVMVDFERAFQGVPAWRPRENGGDFKFHTASSCERSIYPLQPETSQICDDNDWDCRMTDEAIENEKEKWRRWEKEHSHPTAEEDLLILPNRVFGFIFRTRKWGCLELGFGSDGEAKLKERKPRPEPWNELQLPDGHKRVVQSLVESHFAKRDSGKSLQFDLVRAKGKGVIFLLHGVPGVGKTSTAGMLKHPCVAEANHRPLLPITCGMEVETRLEKDFRLAQVWNCVLLLDEADIFLAQRNENDVKRNALVSVFVRVLEYYEGVLFLTTNRVGVFDEAFKSRIHMALYYPPLEWKYTKRIWDTHLMKLQASGIVEVDDQDILEYAETSFEKQAAKGSPVGPVWNGRQIRNAFQSAVALAGFKHQGGKIRLEREHFERVSRVSNEFNHYVWSIKCQSDAEKAEKWGYRFD
ncbi:P-loop containing nucleoside triphosphate hydrolase protein, partial [Cercophora scortea]